MPVPPGDARRMRVPPGMPVPPRDESRWTHIQTTAAQKTLLLAQIRMAVLNLFQLATKQLKVPADVALEDTEAQLDTVLLCMQDLAAIRAELCPREPAAASEHPPLPPSQEQPPARRAAARTGAGEKLPWLIRARTPRERTARDGGGSPSPTHLGTPRC
nr:PREDICTED: coiled-coil domain-containing protein 42 like-2-like [Struthio camelus australis]